ncbi:MAG: LamG domain-containing protein [Candidatus Sericytochromatia bacterium]
MFFRQTLAIFIPCVLVACTAQVAVQPTPTTSATPTAPVSSATPAPSVPQGELLASLGFQQSVADLELGGSEMLGVRKTTDRFGRADQALAFSGDGSYLRTQIDINPAVAPQVTLAAWARFTGSEETRQAVLSHDNGDFDRTFGLDERSGSWGWSAFSGPEAPEVIGGAKVEAQQWVFLATVYDASAQKIRFYVNGQKFESTSSSGAGHEFLHIGSNPSFSENFVGDIDDVFVYKRALSEAEIAQLYAVTRQFPQ